MDLRAVCLVRAIGELDAIFEWLWWCEGEEEEEEERKKDDFQRAPHNEPQVLTPHEPPEPQVIPNLSDLASEDCSSFSFFIYRPPVRHFA